MNTYMLDEVQVNLLSERKAKREIIEEYVAKCKQEDKDEHFFVCDVGDIIEKYQQWVRLLPRVKLFYAVKCNADKVLLQILSDMGASFDCASKTEIESVLELGVSTDRITYTHPYKPVSSLIYAERQGVSLLTFDSEMELRKINSFHPKARLVLRILPNEQFEADDKFGNKFGCPSVQIRDLLQLAKDLKLNVVGVSFHVGSGIKDHRAYIAAIKQSRTTFEVAREIGYNMNVLDIGGGFPGEQNTCDYFHKITNVLNETLDDLFPPEEGVDIIGEPGAYVATSAYTVVANIIGKRWFPNKPLIKGSDNNPEKNSRDEEKNTLMYHVNDSVYGSFLSGGLYDPVYLTYFPKLIKSIDDDVSHESIFWGFTCCGKDCITPSTKFPELDIGDWVYFEDMGAYTLSSSTNFNGLETPQIKYYCSADSWLQVYPNKTKRT